MSDFEKWWEYIGGCNGNQNSEAYQMWAREAWNQQQKRIEQLEQNIKFLEGVAKAWESDYQELKDKYEPEITGEL